MFILAIINQGILGGFRGKIGGVVGSAWKGIAVMRSKALSIANPRTTKQVEHRSSFSAIVAIAQVVLGSCIVPLWNRWAVRMSGYNSFIKANIGAFTAGTLAAPLAFKLSVGKMASTLIASVVGIAGASSVTISWSTSLSDNYQGNTDFAYILILSPDGDVMFAGYADEIRSDGTAVVPVSPVLIAATSYYVYLSFLRQDGTIVSSSSVYAHQV